MWTLLLIGSLLFVIAIKLFHRLQSRATIPALHTRFVLVTGCDTGFGRLLVLRLDELGCHVFAACLTSSKAKELSDTTSDRVMALRMDVTKDDDIERALNEVKAALPEKKGLWAIVNNAGIFGASGFAELMTRKDFQATLEVNLLGMAQVTRVFLPMVRRESGRVINTTSVVGRFALGPTPYVASKFAAVGYCDALRRELYHHNVSVHTIVPGPYATNLLHKETLMKSVTEKFNSAPPHVQQVYGLDYVQKTSEVLHEADRFTSTNLHEVVDAYVHALTSKRPSTSYVVGVFGKWLFQPLWMVPSWMADWIISFTALKPPRQSED